jgi:hypothetical protein
MAKVTSKRLRLLSPEKARHDVEDRLRGFDQATLRQRERESKQRPVQTSATDRGWTRGDLYNPDSPD